MLNFQYLFHLNSIGSNQITFLSVTPFIRNMSYQLYWTYLNRTFDKYQEV